jgi:hypothetical protein
MPSSFARPRGLDRAGLIVSTACAVHCALMPLAAGLLPLLGLQFLAGETAESVLLASAAMIAAASFAGGCWHNRQARPLVLVVSGFGLMLLARTLFEDVRLAELTLSVTGAVMIAGAHLANARLCCSKAARRWRPQRPLRDKLPGGHL